MAEQIAHGEIRVDLEDAEALAALKRIEAAFDRTMSDIERSNATATIDADASRLDDAVNNARRRLKAIEHLHATATIDADKEKLEVAVAAARKEVEKLDAQRAVVHIEAKGTEKTIAQIRSVEAAETRRSRENIRRLNDEARVRSTLERQRIAEYKAAEAEAYKIQRQRTVGAAEERAKVLQLQREYAKLTDRVERYDQKRRRAVGREARAKAELDFASAQADMLKLKAILNEMGEHPPVNIKADIDRRGLRSVMYTIGQDFAKILNKAGDLQNLTVRLGPFTATLKQLALALSFLGPTLVDVAGAAGALVGVLGTGLAGAAALGAGAAVGLAGAFLGLKFSLRNTGQEVKNVRTAMNALDKARESGDADKIADKQKELNAILKNVSPLAREAATGVERFYKNWDAHTKPTQTNLGKIAHDGFQALNRLTPMWAGATNRMSGILQRGLSSAFSWLSTGEGKNLLGGIFDSFNDNLPTLLHGLGQFGQAFLRFAREGARNLDVLFGGFDRLGSKLNAFTQRDNFADTIRRWVSYARDLFRLFGALGRVTMHFFGAGSRAGDGMVRDMTDALNRFDKKITSIEGRKGLAEGFERATKGAEALWNAIAPLGAAFIEWSSTLSPVVTGILKGVAAISRLVLGFAQLVGMTGALGALGATLGALFAIGRIGAFIGMLARMVTLLREAAAAGGALGVLRTIGSGGLFARGAGAAAAADLTLLGSGAAKAKGEVGLLRGAATKLIPAIGTLGTFAGGAATLGVTALAGAAVYGAYKLFTMKSAADKLDDSIKENAKSINELRVANQNMEGAWANVDMASHGYREAVKSVSQLKRELAGAREGSAKYKSILAELNAALNQRSTSEADVTRSLHDATVAMQAGADAAAKMVDADNNVTEARKQREEVEKRLQRMRDQGIEPDKGSLDKLTDANNRLNDALRTKRALQEEINHAHVVENMIGLNSLRTSKDFIRVTGYQAKALSSLADVAKRTARAVAAAYPDPRDVARVARVAQSAIGKGVPKTVATRVVANSGTAEAALRRLKALTIPAKTLRIIEKGGHEARMILEAIAGRKLTPKEQKIVEDGAGNVLGRLAKIKGSKLAVKVQKIIGDISGAERALAKANSQKPKTLTQWIGRQLRNSGNEFPPPRDVVQRVRRALVGNLGSATGSGGDAPTPPTARSMNRAFERAQSGALPITSTSTAQRGMKVSGARLIVGEEKSHPEFVLSTNPSYRQTNITMLRQAAQAMGVQMAATGTSPSGFVDGAYWAPQTMPKVPALTPNPKKVNRSAPSFRKRRAKAYKSGRGYVKYIGRLKTQQDDWEREASIRESQVQEPEDLMIEDGRITDPKTGEDLGPKMKINEAAIQTYQGQILQVEDAYLNHLIPIVAEILRAVPDAQSAINTEERYRLANVKNLKERIKHDKHVIASKNASKSAKAAARTRLAKDEPRLEKEHTAIEALRADRGTLSEDRKEAGFDIREYNIKEQELAADRTGITGRAAEDVKNANEQTTGGGGGAGGAGGGADAPISIEQQTALTLQQNAQALASFGQNFIDGTNNIAAQFTPGAVGGATYGGGGGMMPNASGLSPISGSTQAEQLTSSTAMRTPTPTSTGATGEPTSGGGGTTVNIENNYAAPPPDPHTYSQGVAFEIAAAV